MLLKRAFVRIYHTPAGAFPDSRRAIQQSEVGEGEASGPRGEKSPEGELGGPGRIGPLGVLGPLGCMKFGSAKRYLVVFCWAQHAGCLRSWFLSKPIQGLCLLNLQARGLLAMDHKQSSLSVRSKSWEAHRKWSGLA